LVIVDSWRADELTALGTPQAWALSQRPDAVVYEDHWSGGNVTRTGIFSLFYGIPCTHWAAVSAAQAPPVLLAQAQRAGFSLGLGLSADLAPQAFDRTVFSHVADLQLTRPEPTPAGRDAGASRDLAEFLAAAPEPFAAVLYLDGVHGYSVPEGAPLPFQPAWTHPKHLNLGPDTDPTPYRNLYRNALRAADTQVGQILQALAGRGLMDRTIVVLTSDHGEEFNDNGDNHWGHGSGYTQFQLGVPLVISWPGQEAGRRSWRTTHEDLVATLLSDWLGCSDPDQSLSRGQALSDPSTRPPLVACSYYNHAIVEPDRTTIVYPAGPYEIVDPQGQPLRDASPRPLVWAAALEDMSRYAR
jgi:membrane-anchored protein YejM (alkaline phosphatase superfamily)